MQQTGRTNWFLAVGLLLVVAVHGGLAWALTEAVTASLLTREVALSRQYMQGIVDGDGGAAALFAEPAPSPALTHFATIIEALPGVVRANVYSADRFIRYSSESNLVGLKFTGNHELEESFDGGMSAKIEEITTTPKPEHLGLNQFAGKRFIEAYVPLTDKSGATFAVVELYAGTDGLFAEVNRIKSIVMIAALLASLVMLAVLYGLFRMRR